MTVLTYSGDTKLLRRVFSGFPCGVAALAAVVDGSPQVLVASSFTVGVSQDPPMALFAVQRSSTTWPDLASVERIGVSVLGTTHGQVCRQLASRDKAIRLKGIAYVETETGAVLLEQAAAWMECSVEHIYPAGDHDIIVLRLHGLMEHDHLPLVFHRSEFRNLA
ncbi:flavin reductase family protein [Microbacterium sp. 18062]|uniref:flavin reductase family protein n=1 Tax=Microbacterium sp. 18062 TaxID=2681410 RepID=UPI00135A1440|nr:flavin reductase family protein [Microbacterium sp. 18062]